MCVRRVHPVRMLVWGSVGQGRIGRTWDYAEFACIMLGGNQGVRLQVRQTGGLRRTGGATRVAALRSVQL